MPWRPPAHNVQGRESQWFAACFHGHASFCGCGDFIGHINSLAPRFPNNQGPPHPPALNRPPAQGPESPGGSILPLPALPAPPDPPPRPGGGEDGGDAARGAAGAAEGAYGEEDLELLFAAAEEDDMSPKAPKARHTSRRTTRGAKRSLQFTPSPRRLSPVGRKRPRRNASPRRRTSTPRAKERGAPPAAPAAETPPASPQARPQTPPRRRPETPPGSTHRPGPYIAPPPYIPDLLFPNTQKKKKFSNFDWATEYQLATAFDRPLRHYPLDLPHYPWLPKKPNTHSTYRVSFQLKAPQ
nr:ORF4 [Torque teno virus]